MSKFSLRGLVAAVALASASVAAHADIAINTALNFDSVADGTSANSYLASLGLGGVMSFGNGDVVDDVDAFGDLTGTHHWVDASATYGDVLVSSSAAAVSGGNVLSNGFAPILLQFAAPVDLALFSVQLDNNTWSNFANVLQFLDASGHAISGTDVSFGALNQPGYTVAATGPVYGVSSVLLSFGSRNFDNLQVTTMAAVPEPESWVLMASSMAVLGAFVRRRQNQR
ncbi:MAG TPA: PEP-CTERM sorting domain-containing protein [Aquabacterium sp.]|uniref:PEP-CTERM sorting domain-containing protein n=1 Tax=Aquabacterium sp. TaxID=1872578 RepID=UPI002E3553D0|nr:PEP-CTERM sorting domain-containing protein [Aquabacterium sp.]HEX5357272.1 PEP-CTERM sorting domain-containing protein [Aquabacterium sp.]